MHRLVPVTAILACGPAIDPPTADTGENSSGEVEALTDASDVSSSSSTTTSATPPPPPLTTTGGSSTGEPLDPFSEPIIVELDDPGPGSQFDVPDGALGFAIALFDPSAGEPFGVLNLRSPAGEPAITQYVPIGGAGAQSVAFDKSATAAIPQGFFEGEPPVLPGTWTADFAVTDPAARALVQIQQTEDGAFHGGVLDLHVHLAEGLTISDPGDPHVVSPESAGSDPAIQARLEAFDDALFELFELEVGDVEFHGLPAEYLDLADLAAIDEAIEQTASVPPEQALHILLVQTAMPFPETPVWGLSPGAPGIPIQTGTSRSGLVLAVSETHGAHGDALTLLHELGHYVGLIHTTQIDGGFYDPLDDTPRCENIGEIELSACPDAQNLMFPAFYQTTGGLDIELSPQQLRVVHGSPLYRAFARP